MNAVITMENLNAILDEKQNELHTMLATEQDPEKRMKILFACSQLMDVRLETSKFLDFAKVVA